MGQASKGRILVTGGAGFIGSHVCDALSAAGYCPTVLDNLCSGKPSNLASEVRADLRVGDLMDRSLLAELLPGVEAVVHLAALPSVQLSISDPLMTHGVNYTATLSLLDEMRKAGVSRIIYASSAAIYPVDATHRLSEDTPAHPASPYGLDKYFGEHALRIFRTLHGFSTTALRFFNVYGERQDASNPYSGVISLFSEGIMAGRALRVFGTGEQCRDFVYVGDVARLISTLLERPTPPVLNVATGQSTTLLELIAALEKVTGTTANVQFEPARAGDILESRADIGRLCSTVDWRPTPLTVGLASLVASLHPEPAR